MDNLELFYDTDWIEPVYIPTEHVRINVIRSALTDTIVHINVRVETILVLEWRAGRICYVDHPYITASIYEFICNRFSSIFNSDINDVKKYMLICG